MFPTLSFQNREIPANEMAARVAKTAGALRRAGIHDGDVFALILRNSPVALEVMLAARQIGAYFVPLNWHFKGEEVRYILQDSGARLLVIHSDLYAPIRDSIPAGVRVFQARPHGAAGDHHADGAADWGEAVAAAEPDHSQRDRMTAAIAYTSGTTGRPKGVLREAPARTGAVASVESMSRMLTTALGVAPGARCLISAPLYHTAPGSYVLHAARCGAWLRIEPRFDAEATLAAIERFRISHLYLVPTMFVRLLRLPEEVRRRYDLGSVRFVASTGAPCPPNVKQAMIEWWGEVIYEAYAASEFGYVTVISSQEALRKPGSAGRPLDGVAIRILDDDYRDLPPESIGRIYVRQTLAPAFTYINRQADRDAIERDGYVTLGDMGYVDRDGYLYLTDRRNDLVISGGVNIYPAEIEMQLMCMAGIADCAVFGIPDAEFGQSLVAVIQSAPGAALRADDVRTFLAERLADFKIPKRIEFRDSLPREETGKLFKRRLREEYMRD